MTDVRCPACNRGARVNCPTPQAERYEAGRLRRKMAEACPRSHSENRLPCPMAQSAPDPEKAL